MTHDALMLFFVGLIAMAQVVAVSGFLLTRFREDSARACVRCFKERRFADADAIYSATNGICSDGVCAVCVSELDARRDISRDHDGAKACAMCSGPGPFASATFEGHGGVRYESASTQCRWCEREIPIHERPHEPAALLAGPQ